MNQKGVIATVVILVVFLSLSAGVIYLAIQNTKKETAPTLPQLSSTPNPNHPVCKQYGPVPREDYLLTYTVVKGDTLLSIAKTRLGDTSRVNELITLNKDRYPELSIDKPFLEQGWKLYLPTDDIKSTNGHIYALRGNVVVSNLFNNVSYWGVRESEGRGGGSFPLVELNERRLKDGDCVTVIYQGGPIGADHRVLDIISE